MSSTNSSDWTNSAEEAARPAPIRPIGRPMLQAEERPAPAEPAKGTGYGAPISKRAMLATLGTTSSKSAVVAKEAKYRPRIFLAPISKCAVTATTAKYHQGKDAA